MAKNSTNKGNKAARTPAEKLAMQLAKNPLNVALGLYLQSERKRLEKPPAAVAVASGFTLSHLRTIEAGTQSLPAASICGLMGVFGMSWQRASLFISTMNYLGGSLSKAVGEGYTLVGLAARASHLASITQLQWHREIANWCDRYCSLKIDDEAEHAKQIKDLIDLIALPELPAPSDFQPTSSTNPFSGMSPVFNDMLEHLQAALSVFPPHFNQEVVSNWEMQNLSRITNLFSYVSAIRSIEDSFVGYDWAFLNNIHVPTLNILVGDLTPNKIEQAKNAFCDAFIKKWSRPKHEHAQVRQKLLNQVHFFSVGEIFQNRIKKYTTFDFVQLKKVDDKIDGIGQSKLIKQGRLKSFRNIWIYQVTSHHGATTNAVGFMDDYDAGRPSSFGVALNKQDIEDWFALLAEIKEALLTAKPFHKRKS